MLFGRSLFVLILLCVASVNINSYSTSPPLSLSYATHKIHTDNLSMLHPSLGIGGVYGG